MKRLISILFLLVILLQSTSTLCTLVSFYFNQDYISKNLCVNRFETIPVCKGKCYLNKELKEKSNKEEKAPTFNQNEIQLYCQNKVPFDKPNLTETENSIILNTEIQFQIKSYHSSIFHPPQYI